MNDVQRCSLPDDAIFPPALDEICDRFEAAWRSGLTPKMSDYLDDLSASQRVELLPELIAIDLEFRWGANKSGTMATDSDATAADDFSTSDRFSPWLIEDYLARFPELGSRDALPCDLIVEEYYARRRRGESDIRNGYGVRFPQHGPPLLAALCEVDQQVIAHRNRVGSELLVRCPACGAAQPLAGTASPVKIDCHSCKASFSLAETSPVHATGHAIGHFQLLEKLGSGGFGDVWRARDTSLDRVVAIKIPHAERLQSIERFLREARSAAQLCHPNIVSVHEVGKYEHSVYLVSDYISGTTLAQWMTENRASHRHAVELCWKLADALHHAHRAGVVHRDLKPANIMMDQDAEPHIMDFGLARWESGDVSMTMEGNVLGTPDYMSPEQARGESHLADRRTDVYSLGVILFELLTGEKPFRGRLQMLLQHVIHDEAPSPRKFDANVPRDLETICRTCLEKDPSQRFASVQLLADELQRFLHGEPLRSRRLSILETVWRWCRRNRLATVIVGMLLLFAVAGSVVAAREAHLRRIVSNSEQQLRELLYVSDFQLAQDAFDAGNVGRTLQLLERHRPSANPEGLAGFEWYYLRNQTQQFQVSLSFGDFVQGVQFSADGRTVAAWGEGAVQRWARNTGDRVPTRQPPSGVSLIAISSDLKTMFFSGPRHPLTAMDFEGGRPAKTYTQEPVPFSRLSISPDGNAIAAVDGLAIIVWNVDAGRQTARLEGHTGLISSLAFSTDGRTLASGSYDNTVRLWEPQAGELRHTLDAHTNGIQAVAFSPDDSLLASGSWDQTVRLWRVRDGKPLSELAPHEGPVSAVAFASDGRTVMSGNNSNVIRHWDVQSSLLLNTMKGHSDAVTAVAVSPVGEQIASGSLDGTVKLWDLTQQNQDRLDGHTNVLTSVAFSPDGQTLATGSHDRTIKLWDMATGRLRNELTESGTPAHDNNVWSVAFSPDGSLLASAGEDHSVKLWDLASGQVTQVFENTDWALSVEFSPDGKLLASGGFDDAVRLWDVASGRPMGSLVGHTDNVLEVAFSPDGKKLASAGHDYSVKIWNTDTRRLIIDLSDSHHGEIHGLDFSPDGQVVASGSYDKTIKLWSTTDGRHLATLAGESNVHEVSFSPDGGTIASGSDDGTVTLWDVQRGIARGKLRGHTRGVWSVAFSPDGNTLASAAWDNTARIWRGEPSK